MRRTTIAAGVGVAVLVLGAGTATAAPSLPDAAAQQISGSFTAAVVPPPECTFQLCTEGALGGNFPATYSFTLDTSNPSAPPVARSVITTRNGQLFGDDVVVLEFTSPTTANFTTTVDLDGGTRRYKQADGVIVATGTLDFTRSPEIVGSYTGTIELVPGSAARR